MKHDKRTTLTATLIVIGTGILWGFYWIPVRLMAETELTGAWGTAAITGAATLLLAPFAFTRYRQLTGADALTLVAIALGGVGFMLYSVGFTYGRVAIVILLFYLTPVWSTLLGRFFMGWKPTRMRITAMLTGIAGLTMMLGADGGAPLPASTGEWLGLISGFLWSLATTCIRTRSTLKPAESSFVFVAGAFAGALILAPFLEPWPSVAVFQETERIVGWALLTGGLWWVLSVTSLLWATARLDPAKVGLLLMAEVLVGSGSAAVIAHEQITGLELCGGLLVLLAGLLEIWPARRAS